MGFLKVDPESVENYCDANMESYRLNLPDEYYDEAHSDDFEYADDFEDTDDEAEDIVGWRVSIIRLEIFRDDQNDTTIEFRPYSTSSQIHQNPVDLDLPQDFPVPESSNIIGENIQTDVNCVTEVLNIVDDDDIDGIMDGVMGDDDVFL